jgi:hypothetical protein
MHSGVGVHTVDVTNNEVSAHELQIPNVLYTPPIEFWKLQFPVLHPTDIGEPISSLSGARADVTAAFVL